MHRLELLRSLWGAAATVRDITQHTRSYYFAAQPPITFYLHTHYAPVQITRWSRPVIEVRATLQAPFGWRVASEQDDAGVYFVARRRTLVGELSAGRFDVFVPQETYLILNVEGAPLTLTNQGDVLHVPPPGGEMLPAPPIPQLPAGDDPAGDDAPPE